MKIEYALNIEEYIDARKTRDFIELGPLPSVAEKWANTALRYGLISGVGLIILSMTYLAITVDLKWILGALAVGYFTWRLLSRRGKLRTKAIQ